MKKISLLLFIALTLSCSKELDINPTTSVDANQAKQSIDLLVTGAYSLIGSGPGAGGQEGALYGTDLLLNADLLASENYMQWRGTFNQYNEVSNKAISTTNTSITRMWRKGYAAINLANTILINLDKAKESDRNTFKGQALFLRGIVHFELLRFWMEPSTNLGVPLLTQPTEDFAQIQLPARATIDAGYTSIIADLTEAQTLLPAADDVYANKITAAAFLARVYLTKGDYNNALTSADAVISSGTYSLTGSVEEAFNGTSSESIFEIQQTTLNNAGTANDGLTTFYACDPSVPGSASRGDVGINSQFINQYEPADKRLTLLIYNGTCNKASVTSAKWKDPYANISVIRLSEMYLIRAECNQRLSSSVGDTPVNDVNAIRSKADASAYGSVVLDDILLERDLELAFEGQRIHDYKRTGKQIAGVDNQGNPITIKYTDPQFIFPIPQTEINTNKNLAQNSYYH
jgi:hypothetical protein